MPDKRLKIGFVLFTKVLAGAGTEKVLLNYIKYRPRELNVETVIFQTDYLDRERLDDESLRILENSSEIVTFRSVSKSFKFLWENDLLKFYYFKLLAPILLCISRFTYNRSQSKKLRDCNIVYLFHNDFLAELGRSKSQMIIGSTHTVPPTGRSIMALAKLIRSGLLYHRIYGFHKFFDTDGWLFEREGDFVLPNGVDTTLFTPARRSEGDNIVFLFVGRLERNKGILLLIDAWTRIRRDNFELHIVGAGSQEGVVKSIPGISWHGRLSEEKLARVYRNSDIFVLPTHGESQSLAVLEALSSGMAVITSEYLAPSLAEIASKGAVIFSDNTVEAFSTAMLHAAENIKNMEQERRETATYIHESLDWKIIVRRFYDELLRLYESWGNGALDIDE